MKHACRFIFEKLAWSLLAAVAVTSPVVSGSEHQRAEGQTGGHSALLWRSVLLVDDLDAAVAFYRQVFDLNQAYSESVITDPRIAKLLELAPGSSVELVVLVSDNLSVGNLGLMRVLGDSGEGKLPPSLLFFKSDQLDSALARAREAGATIVSAPPASGEATRMFMLRDPWGHRIAVTERQELSIRYDSDVTSQWVDTP